jgi:hypothetical protein
VRLADFVPLHPPGAAILTALGTTLLPVPGVAHMARAIVVTARAPTMPAAVAAAMRDFGPPLRVGAAAVAAVTLCRGLSVSAAVSAAMAAAAALGESGHRRCHRRHACEKDELTHDLTPGYRSQGQQAGSRERSAFLGEPCAT